MVSGMQTVVRLMLDRLDASFESGCPEVCFTALDIARWHAAIADVREGELAKKDMLVGHAAKMFKQ